MTQSAVSYQIKLLEDRVGMALFIREPRQVTLTLAGRELVPKITEALGLLGAAFDDLTSKASSALVISALPTIASAWLIPRLRSFQDTNPNIKIRIKTGDTVDFTKDDVDAVIRGDDGEWTQHEVFPLFPIEYTPVCTPEYRDRVGLHQPADLLGGLRCYGAPRWWSRWLSEIGVTKSAVGLSVDLVLGVQAMDVALALQGEGVAMVVPTFFQDELTSGRLIRPFEHVVRDGRSYSLIYPKARSKSKKVRIFRDWVIGEANAIHRSSRA